MGWKGLINDPYLDESYRIDEGLRIARQLLVEINRLGVPAGSEFLDVISPQYIGDLISWGAIGARTTESQVHRELASGLSAPIGFKNGTDGNLKIAIDAIQAASRPHHFLSVHKNGQVPIVETKGNKDCHVILRGGKAPNYDAASVAAACKEIEAAKLDCALMVDCSHANSSKQHERQVDVARDIAQQMKAGNRCIFGVMVESHLHAARRSSAPARTTRPSWNTARASPTPASAGTTRCRCWSCSPTPSSSGAAEATPAQSQPASTTNSCAVTMRAVSAARNSTMCAMSRPTMRPGGSGCGPSRPRPRHRPTAPAAVRSSPSRARRS